MSPLSLPIRCHVEVPSVFELYLSIEYSGEESAVYQLLECEGHVEVELLPRAEGEWQGVDGGR